MGYKITIDGFAATGKGTLAKKIAKDLNILYVDSGMIYRTFGLYMLRNNIDVTNSELVEKVLINAKVHLKQTENGPRAFLDNEDVSDLVRTEQVAAITAIIAKIKAVREKVLTIQRSVSKDQNVIMEGRDIGSEVFPDAELKIFLTATVKERAKRRYEELINKGKSTTLEEVENQIANRDREDVTREISPLVKTEDMIEIDTTNLTVVQVYEKVKELILKKDYYMFVRMKDLKITKKAVIT